MDVWESGCTFSAQVERLWKRPDIDDIARHRLFDENNFAFMPGQAFTFRGITRYR